MMFIIILVVVKLNLDDFGRVPSLSSYIFIGPILDALLQF